MDGRTRRAGVVSRRNHERLMHTGAEMVKAAGLGSALAVAAAQTIGYRTAMMARAIGNGEALDHPEFSLMGREKVEAALESGQALLAGSGAFQDAWTIWLTGQTRAAVWAMQEFLRCRTLADMAGVQQRYVLSSMGSTIAASIRLTQSATRLASAGMAPVHRTASANARRLARMDT